MRRRIPQYLHLPLKLLWFDVEELSVIVVLYLVALIFGGWSWLLVLIGPYVFILIKRKQSRGFLKHFLYFLGLYSLQGYPSPHTNQFHE